MTDRIEIFEICFLSPVVDITRPALHAQLQHWLIDGVKRYPEIFEGVIMLDGVAHFVTCWHRDGVARVYVTPREVAEEILNMEGLSTIEPWAPWPERTN
jgi:hypothetical protein